MTESPTDPAAASIASPAPPPVQISVPRAFPAWLDRRRISVAFTTGGAGRLCLLGVTSGGELATCIQYVDACTGLWADDQHLWIAGPYQLWRFSNVVADGVLFKDHDRLFVAHAGYTTGQLNIHDVAVDAAGRILFVNTRFDCLAALAARDSFAYLWKPPFISDVSPMDRCHLTGLAMHEGKPRFMTAFSTTNVKEGWRQHLADGGVVLDILANRVITSGLSMPHSPRYYRGRLWLLNSGTGYFGSIDPAGGYFERMTFCPGYMRGLAFSGDYAIVGLSARCPDGLFTGSALAANLAERGLEAACGLCIIDLRDGQCVHEVRVGGPVSEISDVSVLPDVVRPMALGR